MQYLPEKVKIGGLVFEVILKEKLNSNPGSTVLGKLVYLEQKIYINSTATLEIQKQALYHEMIHAMMIHLAEFEINDNERFVRRLANLLYQVFQENNF